MLDDPHMVQRLLNNENRTARIFNIIKSSANINKVNVYSESNDLLNAHLKILGLKIENTKRKKVKILDNLE
jgi:hypothetical protein